AHTPPSPLQPATSALSWSLLGTTAQPARSASAAQRATSCMSAVVTRRVLGWARAGLPPMSQSADLLRHLAHLHRKDSPSIAEPHEVDPCPEEWSQSVQSRGALKSR